ncbi:MAG: transcriptional regulator [Chlorobi bacterium CHB2]|nr:transcriptional regulator [Chlorobi bacterium CHB2]
MNEAALLAILARGEDSRHQFKCDATNADSLAAELAALANSGGGMLMLGVRDDGGIAGLDAANVRRLNQLLSNAASQHVRPPIHPTTKNVKTAQGLVMIISVPDGLSKPYMDNAGRIWVKSGADKRYVTAREEMQRLFQRASLIYADVVPVSGTSVADLDEKAFASYFNRRSPSAELVAQPLSQLLQNLGLADGLELNLTGLLLFGRNPQRYRPACEVKAVAFPGTVLHGTQYLDSEDIGGPLLEQYQRSFAFIRRNLRHHQGERGFNTLGQLEVPEQAIEELLVNALIHRDYFTSASIRLMVFADRIEIISPGHLPDSLSIEAIRHGTANRRNPTLTEHAVYMLPYRGLGTGIPRALHSWPNTRLEDDVVGNQFKVVMPRIVPATLDPIVDATGQATGQVTGQVTEQVLRLLSVMEGERSRNELQHRLQLKHRDNFMVAYLQPALAAGLIEMTIPDKPRSSKQRYRLTTAGRQCLAAHSGDGTSHTGPHPPTNAP